jgi:hypothetical protein
MTTLAMSEFANHSQDEQQHWRSIVLFGRNVASYKFALAKSLLEIAADGNEVSQLAELAEPFSRHLCEHLARVDRQGTFERSRFLDACRFYNAGRITAEELCDATMLLGFNNVIDAFHVVGDGEVPTRFFIDERSTTGGIRLTDELFKLSTSEAAADLSLEAEARWRLVEEAWDARADGTQLIVLYDAPRELLVPALLGKRRAITEVRPALNGYQKGHCFYCFSAISLTDPSTATDVDHFFPHVLMSRGMGVDLDLPWNLVLACATCNRGPAGKHAALPSERYVQRLHKRNEYLIESNHPLKQSLIAMTGVDVAARRRFLRSVMSDARQLANGTVGWIAPAEGFPLF